MNFAEKGTKINASYYSDLVASARAKRRKERNISLWFLHDNAPVHTAHISHTTIEDAGLVLLDHPPYSPNLAPSDFWLFSHLKRHLRGRIFTDKEKLKDSVEEFL